MYFEPCDWWNFAFECLLRKFLMAFWGPSVIYLKSCRISSQEIICVQFKCACIVIFGFSYVSVIYYLGQKNQTFKFFIRIGIFSSDKKNMSLLSFVTKQKSIKDQKVTKITKNGSKLAKNDQKSRKIMEHVIFNIYKT